MSPGEQNPTFLKRNVKDADVTLLPHLPGETSGSTASVRAILFTLSRECRSQKACTLLRAERPPRPPLAHRTSMAQRRPTMFGFCLRSFRVLTSYLIIFVNFQMWFVCFFDTFCATEAGIQWPAAENRKAKLQRQSANGSQR